MKKAILVLAALVVVVVAASAVWAACGTSYAVNNSAATAYFRGPAESGFTATPSSFFYSFSDPTQNSGTCVPGWTLNTGHYYFAPGGNWGNACVTGCIGTPPTGLRTVLVAYQNLNPALSTHSGKFAVCSVVFNGTRFLLDTMTNGNGGAAAQIIPNNVPVPNITSSTNNGNGTFTFNLSWTAPAGGGVNGALGFYDTAPASDIITSYGIYYRLAAAPGPADGTTFHATDPTLGWVLAKNTASGQITTDSITVTFNPAGTPLWLAMRPNFQTNAPALPFVGGNSGQVGPTAAPVFNNVGATSDTATWTSGVESRVATYQVYWAPTLTDTFKAVGSPIPAKGDNQFYTANYRVITTAQKYYVKIRANRTDGTFEYSAPILVTKGAKTEAPRTITNKK